MRTLNSGLLVLLATSITACSGSDSGSTGAAGGDTGQGGAVNGGATATGGATTQGGAPSTGGAIGNGGISSTGGVNATGGAPSTSGPTTTGGNASTGGVSATGGNAPGGSNATGGATSAGGTASTGGSKTTGGASTAGGTMSTGGSKTTGGASTTGGATSTGGSKPTGGASTAGGATSTGGSKTTGGATSTGGTKTTGGAAATGGSNATGGATGNCPAPNPNLFAIGADVTDQEVAPVATRANLLTIMKSHGFNYIRLRTFVDPKAADGYDKTNGYDDITHTVAFGKQVKDACMGLLVDFHYSDNWADPGKQCVPVAWQGYTTIADLATAVHDYTKDAITQLIAGGARPDMVQIGNETTPGMLLQVCDSGGQPTGNNQVTGSTSNWANLGTLFKAGIQGVKDVNTGILISLHIDRGNDYASSRNYINNAQNQGVKFDAFGESCYQKYQGDPTSDTNTVNGWTTTFNQLSSAFPSIKFFAAEYGPLQRQINDVLYDLPNDQGLGTFNWEPTTSGAWNQTCDANGNNCVAHTLLTRSGTTYNVQTDMALYDQMKIDYASRL